MSAFLTDTLLWTGAILALVLLIRRPVAAVFGPKAAYALWALPMARLLLPPLVLPAWMAPVREAATDAAFDTVSDASFDMTHSAGLTRFSGSSAAHAAEGVAGVPGDAFGSLAGSLAGPGWTSVLLTIWLAGAAIFLVRRYALYFRMRRELLADARPMGEAGRVRLIETPGADGPVAFGVIDKVVALPIGFMAGHDRAARDLALAHELAHHRGHDLVCNMLVQPLFALHWFTPLAALGWRALRRDQEAACDARVIAREPRDRRAAYAAVIARFATEPRHAARLALAAPMACPVLGDRSIVQRLKSLTMTDISARRRWSGRMLIVGAALALPLTASISYAQVESATPPAPPAPAAPPAPLAAPAAPTAPTAPTAPLAPLAPRTIVSDDGKVTIVDVSQPGPRGADRLPRGERRVIIHPARKLSAAERAEFERDMAEFHHDMAELGRDLAEVERDRAEHLRDMEEHDREMAELGRELARERLEIDREVREAVAEAQAESRAAMRAVALAPRVVNGCRSGQSEVSETVTKGGKQYIYVCTAVALAEARRSLESAERELRAD